MGEGKEFALEKGVECYSNQSKDKGDGSRGYRGHVGDRKKGLMEFIREQER